jgi:N-acetylmuramoyl-L-alanine amidase
MKFIQTHSANYQKGRTKPVEYLVIHYTGNNGDTAAGNGNYFSKPVTPPASANYFVDENEVVQTVKEGDTAWHCGTSGAFKHPYCRNANSLGVEICSRKTKAGEYYFLSASAKRAAELAAELAIKHGIPPNKIVRHYDVTGKICPAPYIDNIVWEGFLKMIQDAINEIKNVPSDWAKEAWDWAVGNKITDGAEPKGAVTREMAVTMLYRARSLK